MEPGDILVGVDWEPLSTSSGLALGARSEAAAEGEAAQTETTDADDPGAFMPERQRIPERLVTTYDLAVGNVLGAGDIWKPFWLKLFLASPE